MKHCEQICMHSHSCLPQQSPQPSAALQQGDGTVSYEDPFSAASAVQWFNGKEFNGMCAAPACPLSHSRGPRARDRVRQHSLFPVCSAPALR